MRTLPFPPRWLRGWHGLEGWQGLGAMLRILPLLLLLPLRAPATALPGLQPVALSCQGEASPMGVDVPQPVLSWQLTGSIRGDHQTAWQVLAASTRIGLEEGKADLWDSGKRICRESLRHPWQGSPLVSSQQVFWKVRAWDREGSASGWSPPATWTMGMLEPGDWQAKWIAGASAPGRQGRGWHALEARSADEVKWVQVDLGGPIVITDILLHPLRHAGRDGFGFPVRFRVELSQDAAFTLPMLVADHTGVDYPHPGYQPVHFQVSGDTARYVRVTATRLWRRDTLFCFALQQLEVLAQGKNAAAGGKVSAFDSVEAGGWGAAHLTDGYGIIGVSDAPAPTLRLRREFQVKPGLRRAVLHHAGQGQAELTVNGRPASEDLFSPGWTKAEKTCLYETTELTPFLQSGVNVLGLELAGGMYRVTGDRYAKFHAWNGPLTAIAQLQLDYADGSTATVVTDESWQTSAGPVTFSCIYGGEDYDARQEAPGWNCPGFSGTGWTAALPWRGPGGTLRGQSAAAPPIRKIETLPAVSVREIRPGIWIYDFGQNASLMPRLRVRGAAGAVVRLTPAELLGPDGGLDRRSVGDREAWWQFTCAGGPAVTWMPKFFYHGCRFLEVALLPGPQGSLPVVEELSGVVVHSSAAPAGRFACSDDLFNRIHHLVRWAQRSNLVSVITDCPHRERLAWLEQYHLNGPALRWNFGLARLFAKGVQDMEDAQTDEGLVPNIAPEFVRFDGAFRDSPEWGGAIIMVPWQQYEWTGDPALLRRAWPAMKRYLAYLGTRAERHLLRQGLGDWYDLGPGPPGFSQQTPPALTGTALYYQNALIMARAAGPAGVPDEKVVYQNLAQQIRDAFQQEFFRPGPPPGYATGSQTALALPLVLGLVPPEDREDVLASLVRKVKDDGGVTAGDIGYPFLLRALAEGGRSDLIHDLNRPGDRPGYALQLAGGATSLTEAWDARPESSQNHLMLGQINEWFYQHLAGLAPDPAGPGFRRILFRPQPVGELTWAEAGYDSPYGRISSRWEKSAGRFAYSITIPPGSSGTVFIPAADASAVTEGGRSAAGSTGVRLLRQDGRTAVFAAASGTYHFAADL